MKENQGSLVNPDLVERFKKTALRDFCGNSTGIVVLIVYATFSPGFSVDNVSLLELIQGQKSAGRDFLNLSIQYTKRGKG